MESPLFDLQAVIPSRRALLNQFSRKKLNQLQECVVCGSRYVPEGPSTILLRGTSGNLELVQTKVSETQSKSSDIPTSVVSGTSCRAPGLFGTHQRDKIPSHPPRTPKKGTKVDQNLNALQSISSQLERSLMVLHGLLVVATEAEDAKKIGEIADSMSKVLVAMKATSMT